MKGKEERRPFDEFQISVAIIETQVVGGGGGKKGKKERVATDIIEIAICQLLSMVMKRDRPLSLWSDLITKEKEEKGGEKKEKKRGNADVASGVSRFGKRGNKGLSINAGLRRSRAEGEKKNGNPQPSARRLWPSSRESGLGQKGGAGLTRLLSSSPVQQGKREKEKKE